jgi:hypothetical protein
VQLPPFSRHLIPLRSKYSSQNPVLEHPQSMSALLTASLNKSQLEVNASLTDYQVVRVSNLSILV